MLNVKSLFCILISLSPLRDAGIIEDFSDYVEVNHVYRYDHADKIFKKRMTQVIWWEFRHSVLVRNKDGDYRRGSEFIVKDFRVIWSESSRPQAMEHIVPRLYQKKWVCLFYDKNDRKIRQITSNWKRETHTTFDPEVENRSIVSVENRNKL